MIEALEKQLADNKAAGFDQLQKEVGELKQQSEHMRKQHKEELMAVRKSTIIFQQWTEAFQTGMHS